jgi:HAD superfamily hydrolase (TIGR01509 family)
MAVPAALLIDLDGTLLDTEPLHFEAHRRFLATVGIVPSEAELVGNIGKGDVTFYRELIAARGVAGDPAAWVAAKTAVLIGIYRERPVPANPGAAALLDEAWRRGIATVVVTSSERALAVAALNSAGLDARLPMRVCREDTRRHKPHPEPYLLAAVRLGLPPAVCLAIEDSPSGVAAARTAGCSTAALAGHIPGAELARAGATRVLARLDELLPLEL